MKRKDMVEIWGKWPLWNPWLHIYFTRPWTSNQGRIPP